MQFPHIHGNIHSRYASGSGSVHFRAAAVSCRHSETRLTAASSTTSFITTVSGAVRGASARTKPGNYDMTTWPRQLARSRPSRPPIPASAPLQIKQTAPAARSGAMFCRTPSGCYTFSPLILAPAHLLPPFKSALLSDGHLIFSHL